jgi:hypothetical protein
MRAFATLLAALDLLLPNYYNDIHSSLSVGSRTRSKWGDAFRWRHSSFPRFKL